MRKGGLEVDVLKLILAKLLRGPSAPLALMLILLLRTPFGSLGASYFVVERP